MFISDIISKQTKCLCRLFTESLGLGVVSTMCVPRVLFSVIGDMKKYKTQILPSRTLISD